METILLNVNVRSSITNNHYIVIKNCHVIWVQIFCTPFLSAEKFAVQSNYLYLCYVNTAKALISFMSVFYKHGEEVTIQNQNVFSNVWW